MDRSGSQKVLRVISIVQIIGSILVLVVGVMGFLAIGGLSAAASTGAVDVDSIVQSLMSAPALAFAAITVLSGTWSLLCGIFGLRAANDNQKIMVVWVFLLIGLVLQFITLTTAILNAFMDISFWSLVSSTVWSVFMFWIANNVKQEAGK